MRPVDGNISYRDIHHVFGERTELTLSLGGEIDQVDGVVFG